MTLLRTIAAAGTAIALAQAATADAAIVDVSTTVDTVVVGQTFDVRVAFSAETVDEFLFDAIFEFAFDDALFSFEGASFVDDTTGTNQLAIEQEGAFSAETVGGILEVGATSFDDFDVLQDQQADNFTIVTLTFEALMAGTGDLGLGDIFEFLFATEGDFDEAEFFAADILNGSVTVGVSEVPLPGAAVFLLTGAAGLFARRKLAA